MDGYGLASRADMYLPHSMSFTETSYANINSEIGT
jgi:hypothetical protein